MTIQFSQLKVGDSAIIDECRVNSDTSTSSSQVQRLMMLAPLFSAYFVPVKSELIE